jgi:hypothetical protein
MVSRTNQFFVASWMTPVLDPSEMMRIRFFIAMRSFRGASERWALIPIVPSSIKLVIGNLWMQFPGFEGVCLLGTLLKMQEYPRYGDIVGSEKPN